MTGCPRRSDMTSPADDLEEAVLALPRDERARLARRLIASLDSEVEEAWLAEVRERLAAYERGDLEAVAAKDVIAEGRRGRSS